MNYITLALLLLTGLTCCNRKEPIKSGLEGKPLPSFNLLLADSTTHFNTNSIPGGRPIVLFYFSPRCPYCRAQMQDIIDNMSQLKGIRFYIFTNWSFSEMKSFYQHYELGKYNNILTGVDYTKFFEDYFKATGVPYTAIYGKGKKLNKAFIGVIDSRQIKEVAEN